MSFLDLLSESDLEEMQACFHPVRFAKGECLLHEGESLLGLKVRAGGVNARMLPSYSWGLRCSVGRPPGSPLPVCS